MAYDPDELPENYPAPWETHVKDLMENGPWPCWDPEMDESDFEDPPEYIPFKETPGPYNMFDDKAKTFKEEQRKERAELTRQKQAELRKRPHMSMDEDSPQEHPELRRDRMDAQEDSQPHQLPGRRGSQDGGAQRVHLRPALAHRQ